MCANWKKEEKSRAEWSERRAKVVDLLAFSTTNTKKGKKIRIAHTAEKKRRACPFRSFTICVRVYNIVCVSVCVYILCINFGRNAPNIYVYSTALTSACWLLPPSRIFISMAYHIYFFICSTLEILSLLFHIHSPTHTHTLIFAYLRILLYMCCVCCSSLFALDSISIRNVYAV